MILRGHRDQVHHVAYSPDGKLLASAGRDALIILWDADKGTPLIYLRGHRGVVNCVSFSPDGRTLASAGDDATVRLWDVAAGKETACLRGHMGGVVAAEFSPDGRFIASGGDDAVVRLWDSESRTVCATFAEHSGRIESLAFSHDGWTLASASQDGTVRLWLVPAPMGGATPDAIADLIRRAAAENSFSRRNLQRTKRTQGVAIGVAFNPGRYELGLACSNGDAVPLDLLRDSGDVWRLPAQLRAVAFAPDGKVWACVADDGSIYLTDSAARPVHRRIIPAHTGLINGLAFSPKGDRLASAGADHTVRLWDLTRLVGRHIRGWASSRIRLGEFASTPDGQILIDKILGNSVRLWRTQPPGLLVILQPAVNPIDPVPHFPRCLHSVAMSPDGTSAATSENGMEIQVWDVGHRRLQATLAGTSGEGSYLLYSADSKVLVTAEKDIVLWDLTSQPPQRTLRVRLPQSTECAALARDGAVLAAGVGEEVWVWDVPTATLRVKLPLPAWGLALSPDGRTLAASLGATPIITLWDTRTGNRIHSLSAAGRMGSTSLAFSTDGKTLAWACDGGVCLWQVVTGQELFFLNYEGASVSHVEFSLDGRTLRGLFCGHADSGFTNQVGVCLWPADAGSLDSREPRLVTEFVRARDGTRKSGW